MSARSASVGSYLNVTDPVYKKCTSQYSLEPDPVCDLCGLRAEGVQEGAHRRPRDGPQFVVRDSPGAQPCACLHGAGEQRHELLGGLGGIEPAQPTGRVGFAANRPSRKVRYVLLNPGTVATSFSGEYDAETEARIESLRQAATSVEKGIEPILAMLDDPPAEPISASMMGEPISLTGPAFDPEAARRLHVETEKLLSAVPASPRQPYVMSGVSTQRLREVLDSRIFATVATIQPDGSVQQSVVWVARDGDDMLFMIGVGAAKNGTCAVIRG